MSHVSDQMPEAGNSESVTETAADKATNCNHTDSADIQPVATDLPIETGGRDGPEPTRYGDWEKNGRCIDF